MPSGNVAYTRQGIKWANGGFLYPSGNAPAVIDRRYKSNCRSFWAVNKPAVKIISIMQGQANLSKRSNCDQFCQVSQGNRTAAMASIEKPKIKTAMFMGLA